MMLLTVCLLLVAVNVVYSQGACGGVFEVPASGQLILLSPNYPEDYPHNADCFYSLTSPVGTRIMFDYEYFWLELSDDCESDYISLSDDVNGLSVPIGPRICHNRGPQQVLSKTNSVTVHFHSDSSTSYRGFKIFVNTVTDCGANIEVPASGTVTFQSPSFPGNYPQNADCTYNITSPAGSVIQFDSQVFDVRWCFQCLCDSLDFVEVIDGVSTPITASPMCNYNYDEIRNLVSKTNSVTVNFKTDFGGFLAASFKIAAQAIFA